MKNEIRDLAKDYYVEKGYSIPTILDLLDGKVTKKTVYNWRDEDKWIDLRRAKIKKSDIMKEKLEDLVMSAINEAEANPNPRTFFAVAKIIASYKAFSTTKFEEQEETESGEKTITPETIEKVSKLLGL